MTEDEVRELEKGIVDIKPPKYMIATTAHHKLGDLSRSIEGEVDEENLCQIMGESGDYYVGSWVTGFGFFHVMFPKTATRELTADEVKKFKAMRFAINDQPAFRLNIEEKP